MLQLNRWMTATDCDSGTCVEVKWHKSQRCESIRCIEVAEMTDLGGDWILVRNSNEPDVEPIKYFPEEWLKIVAELKIYDFETFQGLSNDDILPLVNGGICWEHNDRHFHFDPEEWQVFFKGVQAGDFDLPLAV